jgi:heme-degrading monooxygenase HmoA
MMTVITESTIEAGNEARWDAAFQERLQSAQAQPGWLATQVLIPEGEPLKRVIVGTWESHAAWERWHRAAPFLQTRERLDDADREAGQERWFAVHSMASAED